MTPPVLRPEPLRVALVGCGQIADAHLQEIAKLGAGRVAAVCDRWLDLATQAAARFAIPEAYDDLAAMLEAVQPDVVHVATPAHTHFAVARQCLAAGAHVYVEKPFTVDAAEARELLAFAAARRRRVCVGHDQLFDPAWIALRKRIAAGDVGPVRHVESVLGYMLSGPFGAQVATNPEHWVHRLPGGLFQNTISHPLYRITEFLTDEAPAVDARWTVRPGLTFPTELRADLVGRQVSASLTFSTTIAPQRITRVYGETGTLEVDLDGQVVRRVGPAKAPGAFAKLLTPWRQRTEAARAFRGAVWRFLKADIHYFAGLGALADQFYCSIRDEGPPPIAPQEIVRVTALMDEIFHAARSAQFTGPPHPETTDVRGQQRHQALAASGHVTAAPHRALEEAGR